MFFSRLPQLNFKSTLIILLMALQLSACSTDEDSTDTAYLINFGADTNTNATIDTNSNTIIDSDTTTETLANVSLFWTAPAEREDNTALSLSEIASYKIHYGLTQGQYPNGITINDGSAESHTFIDFPKGTYYFVITTIDTNGRESQYSSEVTKII